MTVSVSGGMPMPVHRVASDPVIDASIHAVLDAAASETDRAAQLFGIAGRVPGREFADRFAAAFWNLKEGARLLDEVAAINHAEIDPHAIAGVRADMQGWQQEARTKYDGGMRMHEANGVAGSRNPAQQSGELRALGSRIRSLLPTIDEQLARFDVAEVLPDPIAAQLALLDTAEALRRAEPGSQQLGPAVERGAGLLSRAKSLLR